MSRKAFNFYRSYYDVARELSDKDRAAFLWAICQRQFEGVETELNGLAKIAYISQKHNIDSQVFGYENKTNTRLTPTEGGSQGGSIAPTEGGSVQEKEKEEVKEKLKYQFELFWKKYPNKIAKQKTWDKFKSLKQDEIDSILSTIDDFIAYKPFKDYVHPHPSTYLNQRRWEDVVPTRQDIKQLHNITYDVWYIAKQVPPEMERIMKLTGLTKDEFLNLYNS